jgi:hypothetical protein
MVTVDPAHLRAAPIILPNVPYSRSCFAGTFTSRSVSTALDDLVEQDLEALRLDGLRQIVGTFAMIASAVSTVPAR